MLPASLDDVPADVWRNLSTGRGAWRTPVLASVAPGGEADARVVVIRAVSAAERDLVFHTDARSRKHAQLQLAPRVCLVVHDEDARWQVRLYGEATVESRESRLDDWWQALGELQRAHYAADVEEKPGNEKGRENFAAFHVIVERFHCLWLDDAGNRAAEFFHEHNAWRGRPCRP